MRTCNFLTFFLLIFIIITSFLLVACEQEENERDITTQEVPQAFLSAFNQAYPDAIIKSYAEEIEDGQKFYEVSCTYEERKIDALYHPDGAVAEIEELIPESRLPDAVKQGFTTEIKNGTINSVEKIEKEGKLLYELKAVNNDDKERSELVFSDDRILIEKEVKKIKEKEDEEDNEQQED